MMTNSSWGGHGEHTKWTRVKYPYRTTWVDSDEWAGLQPPLSWGSPQAGVNFKHSFPGRCGHRRCPHPHAHITWSRGDPTTPQYVSLQNPFTSNQHHTVPLMIILENILMDRIWKFMISGQGRSRRWGGVSNPSVIGIHPGLGHLEIFSWPCFWRHRWGPHISPPPWPRGRSHLCTKYFSIESIIEKRKVLTGTSLSSS